MAENPKEAAGRAKAPLGVIPPIAEYYQSLIHEHGNEKYGPFNWRVDAIQLLTYIKAIRRHMLAVMDGQWLDDESGLPHIAHVATNCNIVLDAHSVGKLLTDNMPPPGQFPRMLKLDAERRSACTSDT